MTLGGTDSSAYVGNFTSHDISAKNNQWWTLNYAGTSYGGLALASPVPVKFAIVDTGTSFMYLPLSEYATLSSNLGNIGFDCSTGDYCFSNTKTCDEFAGSMKNLTIQLDSVEYNIPPLGYMLTPDAKYLEKCIVPIASVPNSEGIAMLGDTFMRNYYTVFNFSENTVKMAPNKANAWADPNWTPADTGLGTMVIILIVVGCLVLLILLVLLICRCKNKD